MNGSAIILIAAIGKNRELGRGPELIWRLKEDLKRFKEMTTGHPVIMGRKTFESIGKPLPNRTNIVVTRGEYAHEGVTVAHSIEEAIEIGKKIDSETVVVMGGGEIYKAALPFADRLELTLVEAEAADADVFFPEYDQDFASVKKEDPAEEGGVRYQWVTFERRR